MARKKLPDQGTDAKLPRGFLNFLIPDEPIERCIMSCEDLMRLPEPPELPEGMMLYSGIQVDYSTPCIQFHVPYGDQESKYYNISKWGEAVIKVITDALCRHFIDGMREWDGFCLNVHLKSGRVIKYFVSYAAFESLMYEIDPIDGSGLSATYSFDGETFEEEVLLLNWLEKQPPPDLDPVRRHQSMGPNEIRTAEDMARVARLAAINHEREKAIFTGVVVCLARERFLSRKYCETCDAIGWPTVWVKQGQSPLSVRFCPKCERRYRLAQKR